MEKQWTNDSEAEIVNIFPDGDEIIVIDAKAINVLDNVTGALLFNTVFDVDERVLNVKTKNEIADLENKSLYVFTFLDGESYLNQFKQNTTSVMNTEEDEILSVYPIPVSDRLYFENLKTFKMSYIYDANGRLVLSSGITTDYIITESLPKGTYVLQLVNPSHSITRKFIKM